MNCQKLTAFQSKLSKHDSGEPLPMNSAQILNGELNNVAGGGFENKACKGKSQHCACIPLFGR